MFSRSKIEIIRRLLNKPRGITSLRMYDGSNDAGYSDVCIRQTSPPAVSSFGPHGPPGGVG